MEDIKTQLANRLKEASNVLVTVTTNPTVDQLASAIALTLILNRLGKHATAVFSGQVPKTLDFLHPEKTIEKNTDSLRDFIISLDKAKADKLRYKIEDQFVKIFITPYHTSISDKDLVFSQGDFNVDVVVGLGVHKREELDQVITAHGRILHDATVSTINTQQPSTLGSINWSDKNASSLCEMLVYLSDLLAKEGLLDAQISNSLLTGIVAETQRFSNQKTTSMTMSASSRLLAAGANQQLIATQLAPPPPPPPKPAVVHQPPPPLAKPAAPKAPAPVPKDKPNDKGEIVIEHNVPQVPIDNDVEDEQSKLAQVQIDDQGELKTIDPLNPAKPSESEGEPKSETHPEATGALGKPPAGSYMTQGPKDADDTFLQDIDEDEVSASGTPAPPPLLSHDSPPAEAETGPEPQPQEPPKPSLPSEPEHEPDLSFKPEPEAPKSSAPDPKDLDAMRSAVESAIDKSPDQEFMAPIESLNAQPVASNINNPSPAPSQPDSVEIKPDIEHIGGTPTDTDPEDMPGSPPPPPVAPPLLPPPTI